jgi:hypothetical protein
MSDPTTYAGYRRHTTSRASGAVIVLLDAAEANLSTHGGRWVTICDTHGGACNHDTQYDARNWMAEPHGWCPDCARANVRRRAARRLR